VPASLRPVGTVQLFENNLYSLSLSAAAEEEEEEVLVFFFGSAPVVVVVVSVHSSSSSSSLCARSTFSPFLFPILYACVSVWVQKWPTQGAAADGLDCNKYSSSVCGAFVMQENESSSSSSSSMQQQQHQHQQLEG